MGLINFILGLTFVYCIGKFFLYRLIYVPFFWVILISAAAVSFFVRPETKKKA